MKKALLFIAVLSLFSCKKKHADPIPEPDPVVVNPPAGCKTGKILFTGGYYLSGYNTTINFVFVKNNCPTENANTYEIIGLKEALVPVITSGTVSSNTLTANSDETVPICRGIGVKPEFTFLRQTDGRLILQTDKWVGANNRIFIPL